MVPFFLTRGSGGLSASAVALIAVGGLAAAQQPRLPESGRAKAILRGVLAEEGGCEPDAETLCLHDGRYELQADWWTGDGNSGLAKVVPKATRDSGLFRFFDADNWEILIKVLDGCPVSGHHWVYGASTTDLGYKIRVRDTATDDAKTYRNEPGRPAPAITDGRAFPGACEADVSSPIAFPDWRLQGTPGKELVPVSLVSGSESGCVTNGTSLCLADGRFEVKVGWSTAGGGEGSASAVPGGTNNSGLFYFFDPDNWEMLIKVLDGCAINGHYWVYSAAATDLGLDITVTDTATGARWTYEKGPGPPAPAITESEAFPESCGPLRPVLVSPGSIAVEWHLWEADIVHESLGHHPFAADFDGDGDDDVLIVPGATTEGSDPSHSRTGLILVNNGDFTFEVAAGDRPGGVHPSQVLMADFNGDGRNDFFVADHGYDFPPFPGWYNQLLLWSAGGYVDATNRLPTDPSGFTHDAAVGDIDGDGDVDILVANAFGGPFNTPYFAMNDGGANFTADTSRLPKSVLEDCRPWAVELADLDGDGHVDLLAAANGESECLESLVYWGSASGEYRDEHVAVLATPEFLTAFGPGAAVVTTTVRDINRDGQLDLMLGGYDRSFYGRGLQVLVNLGGRAFADETTRRFGESAWSATEALNTGFRFLDLNRDGTVDIVPQLFWDEDGRPNVLAWLNDGTGHYVPLKTTEFDDADALARFALGRTVQAGGGFKQIEFYGESGTFVRAQAAVVVENAVIRPRF